jgi:D-glycero-alpha-D-manno-heptose 1-phosphate guanylyltransferase
MKEMDTGLAQDTTALILAGGKGTRIAALVPNLPKPMVEVAGQPFLEWVLRRLTREKIAEIVLSIGYKAEVVIQWMESRDMTPFPAKLRYLRENEPLGTGGAIAEALPSIATPYVLILNGDTLLLADFLPAVGRMADEKLNGMILARTVEDTGRYGRLRTENGILKEFQEKQAGRGLINGGVYAFQTAWLKTHLNAGISSFEIDVIPRLLKDGAKIGIEATEAPFIDIGTPETLAAAGDFVLKHKGCFS